jgi:hypothetical protein
MSNFTCHKCIPGSPYLTSVDLLTFAHQIIFCHKEHHHKKQQMGCHMWPQRSLSPNDSSTLPDPCSVITCSDVHLQPALICMTLIACTSRLSCVLHDALVRCLPQHVTLCKISGNCAACHKYPGAYPNMSRCARLVSIVPLVYLACCMMVHSSSALHYVVPSVTHLQGAGLAVNQLT